MTYVFNIILCVSIMFSSFFYLSVWLQLLKHAKLIVFGNYNECKTKHLFLIKQVVTRFDKKNSDMAEKSIDEEKNLLLQTLKKKTQSLRTLKRILSMRNLRRTFVLYCIVIFIYSRCLQIYIFKIII